MSKSHIVNKIVETFEAQSLTKSDAGELYDLFTNIINESLNEQGSIRLHGIGTLYVIECEPKKYRNPKNGEIIVAPKQKRIRFRPSKNLLSSVNS